MRNHYDFSQAKRGPVIPSLGKTRITIMLDDDVIEHFRARSPVSWFACRQHWSSTIPSRPNERTKALLDKENSALRSVMIGDVVTFGSRQSHRAYE